MDLDYEAYICRNKPCKAYGKYTSRYALVSFARSGARCLECGQQINKEIIKSGEKGELR